MSRPATQSDDTPPSAAPDHEGATGAERRSDLDEAADIVARMGDATLLRGVAAVIVGFIVLTFGSVAAGRIVVGASGLEPGTTPTDGFLAWSLVSRFAVAMLAGYLTARAAPRAPLAHAMALAGLVVFLALAAMWGLSTAGAVQDPAWYPTVMVFVGPGGVLAGAGLRVRSLAAAIVACLAAGLAGCGPPPETTSPPPPSIAATATLEGREDAARVLRGERNFLTGYPALAGEDEVHIVIEIPAGTNAKWETTKDGDSIAWEMLDTGPRVVQYLAYPGNYGMIPRTLLPEAMGGDGDPLDVILLGPAVPRGSVVRARPVGVLELLDTGEDDDKIVAVPLDGLFSEIRDLEALRTGYAGALEILDIWFGSYKGPGVVETGGWRDAGAARAIIERAAEAYEARDACGELADEQGHGPDPFGDEWWRACRARMERAGTGSGS